MATLWDIRLLMFTLAYLYNNVYNSKLLQMCMTEFSRAETSGSHLRTSVQALFFLLASSQLRHYNSTGLPCNEFKPLSCFVPLTKPFDLLCPQKTTSQKVADFQGATSNATRPTKLKRPVLEISKEDLLLQKFESY